MEEVSVQWWGERPGERAPPAGWLRTAWNFCWEWGLQRPFPHRAGELDVLRRAVRAYLAEREAPGYKLEALADWSADKYVARRSFEERRPSFAESRRRLGRPPLRPRPFWLVPELPPMMREPDAGGRFRPLVQFAKDWAVRPARRGRMMADPPPPETEPDMAASIAAVVHALCDLDETTPPQWVFAHRVPRPRRIWGLRPVDWNSGFGRLLLRSAPAACADHNIFFAESLIMGPLWLNPSVDHPLPEDQIPPRYRPASNA